MENVMKEKVMEVLVIKDIIEKMEEEMVGNGCIFVCLSGIEFFLCVMVEVFIIEEVDYYVDIIVDVVWVEIGID